MPKYVVTFRDNHQDEFDVQGFKIMTEKEYRTYEELAYSITWEFAFYANNEALVYTNGEDFLSRIDYKEITNNEYDTLEKIFGSEFGTFISEDYLQNILDGEEKYDGSDFDESNFDDDYMDED